MLVSQPVTLSRTPSKMAARPPEFGEQTEEVLAEFGFNKDEIADLRQRKVVAAGVAAAAKRPGALGCTAH
jgi:formyl-CoA transferase